MKTETEVQKTIKKCRGRAENIEAEKSASEAPEIICSDNKSSED